MKVVEMKLSQLTPYENNVKEHPPEQVEQIKQSILQYGMNDPIAVWGKNNLIVEGHGRYEAMKELGEDTVPVIRLDHLSDEQRRAYTIVHNKLTMNSGFDIDALNEELRDLDIDLSEFDIEIPEIEVPEVTGPDYKVETLGRRSNILNLARAQYPGVGSFDIPEIYPEYELPKVQEWIGFNYVKSDKRSKEEKAHTGVHFFIDDYQFERIWNNPELYVDVLEQYGAVIAPDFSPYGDMPLATQLFNHYRKHWVARYLQEAGVTVIPCIRASTDSRSLDWYLDGEPEGGIVAISTMWVQEDTEIYHQWEVEYETMVKRLHPTKVLVYGKMPKNIDKRIAERIETFTEKRWK